MTDNYWRRTRLKYIVDANAEVLSEGTDDDFEFVYVDIGNVAQGSMRTDGDPIKFADAPSRARRLAKPGDSVVSTVRTYLRAVATVPAHDEPLVFSTGFAVLSPLDRVHPRFLSWYLQGDEFVSRIEANSTGVSYPAITATQLVALDLRLPSFDEQCTIANYLDRETARIDTLINEQQRLIALLRERRDSAWAAHVEAARHLGRPTSIRRVIDSIVDGPFGSSLTSAHYSDEGARVIRLGNIGVNEFKDNDAAFIPLDYASELEAHAVEQGDVVVAGLGDDKMPLGRAAVVPALGPAVVKADCYRLRPNTRVSAKYLAWVLSAPQTRSQIMLLARGSTRARLNTKVVQQVEIPLPNRDMQDDLVTQSYAEAAKIDALIAEAARLVELARERRAALITAAVTGQIDVRGMA